MSIDVHNCDDLDDVDVGSRSESEEANQSRADKRTPRTRNEEQVAQE